MSSITNQTNQNQSKELSLCEKEWSSMTKKEKAIRVVIVTAIVTGILTAIIVAATTLTAILAGTLVLGIKGPQALGKFVEMDPTLLKVICWTPFTILTSALLVNYLYLKINDIINENKARMKYEQKEKARLSDPEFQKKLLEQQIENLKKQAKILGYNLVKA